MREILFRRKRIDNGKWVTGFYFSHGDGKVEIWEPGNLHFAGRILKGQWYFVDPDTVGEYTGFTDKHGVKMFEGDIVKYMEGEHFQDDEGPEDGTTKYMCKNVIEYQNGEFFPRPMCENCADEWYSHGLFDFEVIGNIHDNPELLKKR